MVLVVKVIVSEIGEKAANVVYTGRFGNRRWIAVKKHNKVDWPAPEQFKEEAQGMRKLIGYCCAGDERQLLADYMPNDTPAEHLFHWEKQSIEWPLRLRVAFYIADALDYCNTEDRPLYQDLNAYIRVLFDEEGDPRLSSFGTHLAYTPPEYLKNGRVYPESVIYSFSSILLNLPNERHIPPSHFINVSTIASPTVYGQHSLCHLVSDRSDAALLDTCKPNVQCAHPD
ncbi:hypothetical protein AB3S75_043825 [Citrus x aurantiifolia]